MCTRLSTTVTSSDYSPVATCKRPEVLAPCSVQLSIHPSVHLMVTCCLLALPTLPPPPPTLPYLLRPRVLADPGPTLPHYTAMMPETAGGDFEPVWSLLLWFSLVCSRQLWSAQIWSSLILFYLAQSCLFESSAVNSGPVQSDVLGSSLFRSPPIWSSVVCSCLL